MFDTVFGLPVHAIVVHAVVVLVPLAAVGGVLIAVRPSWSRRFGILVVVAAGLGAVSAVVAKESGEQLATRVGIPQVHADLGDAMPVVAGVFFVAVTVFWLFDRGIPANRHRPAWLMVLAVVVIVAAIIAIVWTVRVGHTGAEAVWGPIVASTTVPSQPG